MPTYYGDVDGFVMITDYDIAPITPTYLYGSVQIPMVLNATTGDVVSTSFEAFGETSEIILTGSGSSGFGRLGADYPPACTSYPPGGGPDGLECWFSGTWTHTAYPTPEPATVSLL